MPESPMGGAEAESFTGASAARDDLEPLRARHRGETRYRDLVEEAAEGVWVLDEGGVTEYANPRLARWLGYEPREMVGLPLADLLPPEQDRLAAETLERRRRGVVERRDLPLLHRDGSRRWALVAARPMHDAEGRVAGSLLWVTDITGRRRVEGALRRRARQQAAVSELAHRALMGAPFPGVLQEATGLLARTLGMELAAVWEVLPGGAALRLRAGVGWPGGLVGQATVGMEAASHPGFVLAAGEPVVIDNLLAEARFSTFPLREQGVLSGAGAILYHPAGPWGVLAVYSTRHRLLDAEDLDFLVGVAAVLSAAMERARSEAELRGVGERFDLLARATNDVIWERDLETGEAWYSPAFHALLGLDPQQVRASVAVWESLLDDDDRARVLAGLERAIAGRDSTWSDEYRLRRADGGRLAVYDRAFLARDGTGRALRAVGAFMDVTPRRELEEARGRARKMDALGRLAGGVAHDLNNQLTAMLGYAELLLTGLPESDARRLDLEEIRAAAVRSVGITRRLLALGGRQLLRPQVLAPNEVVAGLEPALRREAGEAARLVTILGAGVWPIEADPAGLEEALLELVANARLAMPGGGELTIETANVELGEPFAGQLELPPGEYVMLAVRDSGEGMEAETRARAFEPFFTTRPAGTASGLGLSTVYGIARQSGGGISLHSEPGLGTTVKLFLPRGEEAAPAREAAASREAEEGAGGGGTSSPDGGTS